MINLGVLKNLARAKKYPKGSVISCSGNLAAMYIVLKGEVGLYSEYSGRKQVQVRTISSGEFYDDDVLLLDRSISMTAVALTDVIALPVYKNNAIAFLRDEPEMAFELLQAMCSRMEAVKAYETVSGQPFSENKQLQPVQPAQPVEEKSVKSAAVIPAPTNVPKEVASTPLPLHFALFPEGHGNHPLPMNSADREHLLEKGYECPVCKKEFKAIRIKNSQLVLESTDKDMRNRYKGVEPMYYDVVTCPHCLYSALADMFSNPDKPNAEQLKQLQTFKAEANLRFGREMDTATVFAGYYLALLCAPICFFKPRMAIAKLLLRLSRIYQDSGNAAMEEETAKKALEAYMAVYLNEEISEGQEQQLCLVVAELYLKQNDLTNAKNYFFRAKMNRNGSALVKDHAERRLLDIRDIEAAAQQGA